MFGGWDNTNYYDDIHEYDISSIASQIPPLCQFWPIFKGGPGMLHEILDYADFDHFLRLKSIIC